MMGPKFFKPLKSLKGFTLLETMIALMIVAVALPALVTLVMTQLDGAASVRDKTYAYWVAENELTRLRLLQQQKMQQKLSGYKLPEQQSGETEMAGMLWQWQMQTTEVESLPVKGFKRVEISVRLGGVIGGTAAGRPMNNEQPALARLVGYIGDPVVL